MRGILLSVVLAGAFAVATPTTQSVSAMTTTPTIAAPSPVVALQVPDKQIEVTIDQRGGGVRWYRSPVWIAIGALAAVVVLLLVILAVRGGGGTTIVKG